MDLNNKTVIISRTDSIGDVILTLPLTGYLKSIFPTMRIIFLGRSYTRPIINHCEHVDDFLEWNDDSPDESLIEMLSAVNADVIIHVFPKSRIARLAKKAAIKIRVGVSHRLYNFLYCNRLPGFTRKNSNLHEAQLNFKLLAPFDIDKIPELTEIPALYGWKTLQNNEQKHDLLDTDRKNIILHPKSQGSAVEWGLENFKKLTEIIDKKKFKLFISGTEEEKNLMGDLFEFNDDLVDLRGKFELTAFISFISQADGLVAASTGPLHIAAASGIHTLGLYVSRRPIHPGRWAPLGLNASFMVNDENCENCAQGKDCNCIQNISPERVKQAIESFGQNN